MSMQDDAVAFRDWRKRMGLNLTEAAEALGCSRNTVPIYESGQAPIPLYIRLACSALSLGVRPITTYSADPSKS